MATYYINADSGSDGSGDGSSGNPWEHMEYAYSQMSGGDTIILQDSVATYSETDGSVYMWSEKTPVTFTGESAAGCVIENTKTYPRVAPSGPETYNYNNLTFTYPAGTNQVGAIENRNNVLRTTNYTDCVFRDIELTSQAAMFGQYSSWSARWNEVNFTRCQFYRIYGTTRASNAVLFRSYIALAFWVDLHECAFYLSGATQPEAIIEELDANSKDYVGTLSVRNCIFASDGAASVDWWASTSDLKLKYEYGSNMTIYNSCFYNISELPSGWFNDCITSDPLFIDPDNGNLNLRPESPCINAGILY